MLFSFEEEKYIILQEKYRLSISTVTNLSFLCLNGHVITLGAGDLAFDVALLVVGNPARRFAIVVLVGFLEQLLFVQGQVIKIWIVGVRIHC